jgi:hypothetical protein
MLQIRKLNCLDRVPAFGSRRDTRFVFLNLDATQKRTDLLDCALLCPKSAMSRKKSAMSALSSIPFRS